MKLLVSSCNRGCSSGTLFILDTETGHRFDIKGISEDCLGVSGITKSWEGYTVISQCKGLKSRLTFFDQDLNFRKELPLKTVEDGHSVSSAGSCFFVVSAGNNSIIEVIADGFDTTEKFFHDWNDRDQEGGDICHVNSIYQKVDFMYVSMFGFRKSNQMWSEINHGSILKVYYSGEEELMVGDLYHPHSVCEILGHLSYCVSGTQEFVLGDQRIKLSGYTRGIAYSQGRIWVATSASRNISKSTGAWMTNAPGNAAIYELDLYLNVLNKIEIPDIKEIFELEVL